jgi:branched-chain amino acid transport system permease protein
LLHAPVQTVVILGLAKGAIYALMALGITLTYRAARVINFAQGEIGTTVAFVAWWLIARHGAPWALGALAALAIAALIGYAMHRFVAFPMRDAPRTSVMITTLGVAFLLFGIELKLFGPSPETLPTPFGNNTWGLQIGSFVLTPIYITALIVAASIAGALAIVLTRTRFGLGVLASAQDPSSARLLGIPANAVSAFTWTAAALLGGIAGLLVAPTQGVFFAFQMSGLIFFRGLVASLIGGLDSLTGAAVGAVVVGEIDSFAGFIFNRSAGVPELVLLAIILVVMVVRPTGLLGAEAAA